MTRLDSARIQALAPYDEAGGFRSLDTNQAIGGYATP